MGDEFKNADFLNDKEKMRDFIYLPHLILQVHNP